MYESSSDRQAGAEIENSMISPEAVEAGVQTLWDSGAVETPMPDLDRDLVKKIFRAMTIARP